ncbi:MAG: T9SS type A sorting domain-containing protein [candidate division Zixibacteria bacterium]|nr:T9SS type A sorting domain-containing protein [candidate division Zixibacteria bacterium]
MLSEFKTIKLPHLIGIVIGITSMTTASLAVHPREHPSSAGVSDFQTLNPGDVQGNVSYAGAIWLSIDMPRGIACGWGGGNFRFGCVRGTDTLLTAAWGFRHLTQTVVSSSDPDDKNYNPQAKANQQEYAVYTDMPEPPFNMDSLMRSLEGPTGIEIHQTSYAWTDDGRKRSILVDYWIKNASNRPIQKGVVGLSLRGLESCVNSAFAPPDQDNLCGLIRTAPGLVPGSVDTLNLVWLADNDGDMANAEVYRSRLPVVLGARILRVPEGGRFNFNWLASLERSAGWARWETYINWGPTGASRQVVPTDPHGWYRAMINEQIDYDQVYSSHDFSDLGWNPPAAGRDTMIDIADGAHPEMLLSHGPIDDIAPGDSVEVTVAFSIGYPFHRDPLNFATRFNADNPRPYLNRLDFSDLIANTRAIQWAFDTPGLDSDPNDGIDYRGKAHLFDCDKAAPDGSPTGCDSVFYEGDGIADFGRPVPPPPPVFTVTTKPSTAILHWDGSETELSRHAVTGRRAFEGYRIYAGRDTASGQFSMVASWDKENYCRFVYDTLAPDTSHWRQESYPYTLPEWQRILGGGVDPRDFPVKSLEQSYRDVYFDTVRNFMGEVVDVAAHDRFSCWLPQSENRDTRYSGDTGPESNIIQQVGTRDTTIGGRGFSYGIYEAVITNLQPSIPLYFAVTTFDQGDYVAKLPLVESDPSSNFRYGQPVYSANVVMDSGLKVSVYPNPYKTVFNDAYGHRTSYYAQGHEGQRGTDFDERDRRIHFINLPDTAVITIYSLAGDLIRRIYHPDPHRTSYTSEASWDLVTRSAEAVTPGIYIYHIASGRGSQVGKIVIIK